jgi:hypothetical protein
MIELLMTDATATDDSEFTSFETYCEKVLAVDHAKSPESMAFMLTCMDYRYPQRILDAMARFAPGLRYDQFVLAGASLGACRGDWMTVLIDHIKGARALGHKIDHIVILDHRDCGAYYHPKKIGVEDVKPVPQNPTPKDEMDAHRAVMEGVRHRLMKALEREIPGLRVDGLLLTREQDDIVFVSQ